MHRPTLITSLSASPFSDWVQFYFQQRRSSDPDGFSHQQTMLPTGCTFIGFLFSTPIEFDVGKRETTVVQCGAFFGGQIDGLYSVKLPPDVDMFGVVLRPTTAWHLLRQPVGEFRNAVVEADFHIDRDLQELQKTLIATSFAERVYRLEQWLRTKMDALEAETSVIDRAVRRVIQSRGAITTKALAKAMNVSERHLQRGFRTQIGISPRRYANIIKINHLIDELNQGGAPLDDLIHKYGYYDTSHFRRQFRVVARTTLSAYLKHQERTVQLVTSFAAS